MKTVAVVEGWAGGPKLSHRLRKTLSQADFRIIKKVRQADVIFAHSTGCYRLPKDLVAELIILLDPPYWPGRSIAGRWLDLMKTDTSLLLSGSTFWEFLTKKLWEVYYIFAKPIFTWSVIKNQSDLSFLE